MHIQSMPLDSLHLYPGNPRVNNDAVDAVAKSIREFGWRAPIVVDAGGVIICGHTRYKAAQQLGLAEVPVHVATDLTPIQIQAYRLADNQTSTLSSWDGDLLTVELEALREANFDLDLLGFGQDDLEKWLAPVDSEGQTDADEVPEAPEEAVSRLGEIYVLGEHRLICGDSTHSINVDRVMAGDKADLLLTDPPYNVSYVGKTKDALTIDNDHMDQEKFRDFLTAAFKGAAEVMKPGGSFYIWHADLMTVAFRAACEEVGWQVRQGLVWVKNILVLGRHDYHYRHEPCLYGWTSGEAHRWYSDRKQTTVLEYDKPSRSTEHPTMKPVELFVYQMNNSCPRGGLVLDIFGGSGTTMIAAEKTGRRARLVELSPQYCDVIRRRWAQFVHGEDADWAALTPTLEDAAVSLN